MIPAACALFLLLTILVVSWLRWEHLPQHRENCEVNKRLASISDKPPLPRR